MPRIFEKGAVLAALLLAIAIIAAASAVAEQSILAGATDITITDEIAGKTLEDVKGTCNVIISAFVYDTASKPPKLSPVYIYGIPPYSQTISKETVGMGLRIVSAEDCKLAISGFVPYLKKASRLVAGWNLVSVSEGMTGKSLNDVKGTCSVKKVRIYSQAACEALRAKDDTSAAETCDGDFIIIDPAKPIDGYLKGRGVWVNVGSDCTLDDGTPSDVLCSEAECAAKSSCVGSEYKTYGCKNKECVQLLKRECTADEKAKTGTKESVNLEPSVEILKVTVKSDGTKEKTAATTVKVGDTLEVVFYVKNTGTKSTNAEDVLKRCNTVTTNCKISTMLNIGIQSGSTLTPLIQTTSRDINPLFNPATEEIFPGNAGRLEVARKTVTIPESSQGSVVITAILTPQPGVEEPGNEGDNTKTVTLAVEGLGLPNLIATAAEPVPTLETIPVILSSVRIKIKNIGEKSAVAEQRFLENKVSILKGNVEICSGSIRNLLTIKHNEEIGIQQLPSVDVKFAGGTPCPIDDKNSNYWAVVEVDTYQASPEGQKGVVSESNENDNKQTFQLKGPQQCTPLGAREAERYCSIGTGTWLTQKGENQQCGNNFECQTELCIRQKCVSEKQKADILKLLGIV